MAINVVKNVKEKEEESIEVGSVVRSYDDERLYMVIANGGDPDNDEYMILDLKTGLFYGGHESIGELVKSYDLVLATNDVDIICNNVK